MPRAPGDEVPGLGSRDRQWKREYHRSQHGLHQGPDRKESIMAKLAEHARAPAVVRVVEMVGVSDKSWSDAAQQVVARASETLRHITGLDVLKSTAVVRNGKIVEYLVNVKVAFVVEGAHEMET
jgi:flavin-binding protein dodecin